MRNTAESAQPFSRPPFYDRPAIACSQAGYQHVHLEFKNMFTRLVDMCEHVVLYPPSIPSEDKAWISRAKFMNLFPTPPELNYVNKRIAGPHRNCFCRALCLIALTLDFRQTTPATFFSIPKEAPNENGGHNSYCQFNVRLKPRPSSDSPLWLRPWNNGSRRIA